MEDKDWAGTQQTVMSIATILFTLFGGEDNAHVLERKTVLTDHRSYHGTLTQKEAESELKQYSQHNTKCYLTRWSKYSKSFKVSVCVEGQCYHLCLSITKEDGGSMYELEGASTQFNDVFKLLEFYETNPVTSTSDVIGTCLNVLRRRATDPHLLQGIDEKPLLAKSHSHAYMNQASYDEQSFDSSKMQSCHCTCGNTKPALKKKKVTELNIDDLKKVKDFLYEIRRKWHDLGIELEVKAEELEVIEAQYSDLGVCLRKMLLVWLKNHLKPPTWEAIEAALESKAINELELAARAADEASSHYNTEHTDDASRMDSREVETAKIAMCLSAL